MELTQCSEDDNNSIQTEPASSGGGNSCVGGSQWTNEQQYYWTNEQALQLIQFYKEYISCNKISERRKRPMWEHIASQMKAAGYVHCTANHCATKYTSMTRQYRVVTENNLIPGNRKRTCFFYDALSEVYGFTPVVGQASKTKSDNDNNSDDNDNGDGGDCDETKSSGQNSASSNRLISLITNINDDNREQEQKSLDKIEAMHHEKMEMFSEFLNTFGNTDKQSPKRKISKKETGKLKRVTYSSDSEEDVDDSSDNEESDFDVVSRTLEMVSEQDDEVWNEPWTKQTSDAFINLLEKYRSMWIDETCKKQVFWELISSELNKVTGKPFLRQQVEAYFKTLTEKYKKVIKNNIIPGVKLITCVYFKELSDLFTCNPKKWYYTPKVSHQHWTDTNGYSKTKRKKQNDDLMSLLKQIHKEKKDEERKRMERLKRMHDDKMKMFSSFLNIVKKLKK